MAIALFVSSGALAGAACTVGPDYKKPELGTPAAYTSQGAGVTSRPADLVRWWSKFNDPVLDELIERAIANNLDLKIAESRIRESRAARIIAGAPALPSVGANASYQRLRTSAHSSVTGGGGAAAGGGRNFNLDSWSATLDAAWEIDLFGETRRAVEAADADTQALIESRRAVLVSLLGDVAREYVEMRGHQRRMAIAVERARSQEQTLNLTKVRVDSGLASEFDLSRARALLESTRAEIPQLESLSREAAQRIAVLLGEFPGSLQSALDPARPVPLPPAEIPIGAPADVLLQRPDLRRAERDCAAASARVGVAVAQKYPKLSLSSSLGPKATRLGDLFDHKSIFFSIGSALAVPLFQGGRLNAQIDVQTELEKQSILQFQQTLLEALGEVESGVTRYGFEQQRRGSLAAAVESQQKALHMAKALYDQGLVDFLNVLEAERTLLQSQADLADSETLVSVHAILVYKALGGGWTEN
jgi:NodT family efflux transporter outer membrane factor (OMF) lipoprotein